MNKERLYNYIKGSGRSVVAFSGGCDSALLSYLTHQIVGSDNMTAVMVYAPSYMFKSEFEATTAFAQKYGIPITIIEQDMPETMLTNPPNRCYFCKKMIYSTILKYADDNGFDSVFDGTNIDELSHDRPGLKALEELNIKPPFVEAKLTKEDIRNLAYQQGLELWNKPSMTCRFIKEKDFLLQLNR